MDGFEDEIGYFLSFLFWKGLNQDQEWPFVEVFACSTGAQLRDC